MKRLLQFVEVACKIKGLENDTWCLLPSTPSLMLKHVGLGIDPIAMADLWEEAGNFKLSVGIVRGELVFFQEAPE